MTNILGCSARSEFKSCLLRCAIFFILILTAQMAPPAAFAEEPLDRLLNFDIAPRTRLEDALIEWGTTAGMTVMINTSVVDDKVTQGVRGKVTARQALESVLLASGLAYRQEGHRIQIIPSGSLIRSGLWITVPDSREMTTAIPQESSIASNGSDGASSGSDRGRDVETVIVTAEKREERLQDVPVPITAVETPALVQTGQLRLQEFYDQIPALTISEGVQSAQSINIRGLPASTFLLDDVPLPGVVPDVDPGNLDHIEVLRGPQGTLYGSSSLGGLVKFVTRDPTADALSARLEAGADGVHNGYDLGYNIRGSVNVPVGPDLAFRFGAFTRQDAGYIDNPILHIDGINRDVAHGAQLTGLWKPSEAFSIRFNALYQDIKGGNQEVNLYQPLTGVPLGDLQQDYVAGNGPYSRKTAAASLIVKGKVGDVELTSLTGYNVNTADSWWDLTPAYTQAVYDLFQVTGAPSFNHYSAQEFSEEIRLTASIGKVLDVLAGLYYAKTGGPYDAIIYGTDPISGAVGGTLGYFSFGTTSWESAAFADITFHINDWFDMQFGGRASDYRQEAPFFVSGPYVTYYGFPPQPTLSSSSRPFTYLFTPRIKLSPDMMIYARLASGFSPGGANTPGPGIPPEYGPEKTRNYEVGAKVSLFDRLISVDASVYRINFIGLQQEFQNSTTGEYYWANAGEARSQGIELAVEAAPARGLKLSSWIVFSDAKLTKEEEGVILYEMQNSGGVTTSVGDQMPFNYRFSGNLAAEQEFAATANTSMFVGATTSYIGQRQGPFAVDRQVYPAYAKADLRTGLRSGGWTATLYANNITDRRGVVSGDNQSAVPSSRYLIQPRTVGVSVVKIF